MFYTLYVALHIIIHTVVVQSIYIPTELLVIIVVGRSVRLSVCPHVFSRTMAVVDTKRGYVGRYNRRAAQQESGAASSKHGIFTWRPKIIYGYYTRCVLIRDHHPTEETYIWKVSTLGIFRWL